MKENPLLKRSLEIVPGAISWGVILFLIALAFLHPVACAVSLIVFDFYWIVRTAYLTILLLMAYRNLHKQKERNWMKDCRGIVSQSKCGDVYQVVIFPVYKEPPEILRNSLEAIRKCNYPRDRMIVVVAFEQRNASAKESAEVLEGEFKKEFFGYLSTFHPDGLPGEKRTKGANATWAAKRAKEFLDEKKIPYEEALVSCFDADTCVEREYFGCLNYHFLTESKPHQASYQPMPVYNNNIWQAPSFARLVEISSSFSQLIESMRLEKFVTFSSHSMSFKTLVAIDYWPVDMVSDDSVIYWKAFLFYKGDYRVVPLYITVSMDVAFSDNIFKTVVVQYKQKRRWAWGVENFPFVVSAFFARKDIPFAKKIRRSFNLLESHVSWAVWAVILVFISPLPLLLGGVFFRQIAVIGFNLPRVTGLLLNFTLFTSLIWVVLSRTILPPRPRTVSPLKNVVMILEWVLVPFIILVLGSTPALDAQTHLMLKRPIKFNPTEKRL